jgi:hypothetical protein
VFHFSYKLEDLLEEYKKEAREHEVVLDTEEHEQSTMDVFNSAHIEDAVTVQDSAPVFSSNSGEFEDLSTGAISRKHQLKESLPSQRGKKRLRLQPGSGASWR